MATIRNLNLNSLRVFAIAARHGNLQRAAEVLNISPGAVSQRIRQLERDLGIVLFERKPRGVALTPMGAKYHAAVEEALATLEAATTDLERANRQVTLHTGPSFATRWLMPRLGRFAALCPGVSLTTEVRPEAMTRDLGRNEALISPGKAVSQSPSHHARRLTELVLVAVCSPNLPRPPGALDTATLLSLPLLQDAHRRWDRLIDATGQKAGHGLLNFDRSALALDAAINGHGVAIAPTFMIEHDMRAGRLVELWRSPDASGEYLFLSWAKQHANEKPLKQTVNWILSEFGLDAVL